MKSQYFLISMEIPTLMMPFKNWVNIMEKAEIKINIHKTRHWFVTRSIRMIREDYKDKAEQDKAIEKLRIYMNWSAKADTMKVYEHYVDEKDYVVETR